MDCSACLSCGMVVLLVMIGCRQCRLFPILIVLGGKICFEYMCASGWCDVGGSWNAG